MGDTPRFVRRSPVARTPRLCPSCLNELSAGTQMGGWLLPQDYFCSRCGYKGYAYLENRPSEDGS